MEKIPPPVLGAGLWAQVSGECVRAEGSSATPKSGGGWLPSTGQVIAAEAAGTIEEFDVSLLPIAPIFVTTCLP